MKNEIEKLNLMYGITVFNIISKYDEFKHCDLKEVANILNEYFCWLENLKNINSFNVVSVGKTLLENKKIRSLVVNEDKEKLYDETRILLKNYDLKSIKKDILKDHESFYTKVNSFSKDIKDVYTSLNTLKDYLYNSNLVFKDLIILFINNYSFKKRLSYKHDVDWTLEFLNVSNEIFNQLDSILCTNRDDLYYSFLWLVSYKYFEDLLFPTYYVDGYTFQKIRLDIEKYIKYSIFRSLHSIHKHFFISIKKYNYDNYLRYNSCKFTDRDELIKFVLDKLSVSNKIFLIETSSVNNYDYSKSEMKELNSLIDNLKDCNDIKVIPQTPDNKILELISENVKFVQQYCNENNLDIKNFCYTLKPTLKTGVSQIYLDFYVNYNNYDYRFVIRKFNKNLRWAVTLKNKKEYHINLYLEDDFKHIVQAMFND